MGGGSLGQQRPQEFHYPEEQLAHTQHAHPGEEPHQATCAMKIDRETNWVLNRQ